METKEIEKYSDTPLSCPFQWWTEIKGEKKQIQIWTGEPDEALEAKLRNSVTATSYKGAFLIARLFLVPLRNLLPLVK